MQNLLNSKDLLAEKRVVAAAEGLDVCLTVQNIPHNYTWAKSLEVVAFEMRDACDIFVWYGKLMQICGSTIQCRKATKEHWIIAAVKAWEARQ